MVYRKDAKMAKVAKVLAVVVVVGCWVRSVVGMATPCPYVWCPDDRNWLLVGFLALGAGVPGGALPGGD